MKKTTRPMGVFKTENDYQKMISRELYEKTPKAVLASLVVSFLLNFKGVNESAIDSEIIHEWKTLNDNGIVPQKSPK